MAYVFRALQHNFDAEVALKILDPKLTTDPQFGDRFIQEARIMRSLKHPHIASVYDVGQHQNIYYLSMEYLPGGCLKDKLAEVEGSGAVTSILEKVARALDYAHDHGIVHRDIKPENILMREASEPVISDFGIARALDSTGGHTKTGTVIGSPMYMSPEQALGKTVDHRSDIYSFGVVCYFILLGDAPYSEGSAVTIGLRHIRDPIPVLPEKYGDFQAFINKALAKEPLDRFSNCSELVQSFENCLDIATSKNIQLFHRAGPTPKPHSKSFFGKRAAQSIHPSSNIKAQANVPATGTRYAPRVIIGGLLLLLLGAVSTAAYFWLSGQPPATLASFNIETQRKLLLAGEYLESSNLAAAADEFLKVIADEPSNQAAQRGLRQIIEMHQASALTTLEQNELQSAKIHIAELTRIGVDQAELDELAELYGQKYSAQQDVKNAALQKIELIDRLLLEAAQAETQERLIHPPGDNAFEKYTLITKLDPGNTEATAGVHRLARYFSDRARVYLHEGDEIRAKAHFNIARKMAPSLYNESFLNEITRQPSDQNEARIKPQ